MPLTWHVGWGGMKHRTNENKNKEASTKTKKDKSQRYKEQSTVQTLSHFPSPPWKLCPNMWTSSFEIYALKTSAKEEGASCGWGGQISWLTCFHCGIIMMINSLLHSYSKQWHAQSWWDSLTVCWLCGFPFHSSKDDDPYGHFVFKRSANQYLVLRPWFTFFKTKNSYHMSLSTVLSSHLGLVTKHWFMSIKSNH